MKKKGFEISFSWIFAVLVGAVILFLAIYFATKIVGTGGEKVDAQTAAKLAILLEPLKTNIGETEKNKITFGSNTRIYNKCDIDGNFGEQRIGIASYSFGKWKEPTYGEKQYSKYIFSQETEEGKEFYVFVKTFALPFKVSEIIVLTGEKYCFINAPESIKEDLDLGISNFQFTNLKSNCSEKSKKVCFSSSSGCDISVYGEFGFERGYVNKEGEKLDYIGELVYAAIFSSPEVYNCNAQRLKMRLINLCSIYKDEIKILERRGCNSNLDIHLTEMINLANSNVSLSYLQDKSEQIKAINDVAECKLFET